MPAPSRHLARALACWLLLAVIAILAGALRETFLRPALGEAWAHRLGTVLVCVLFLLVIERFVARLEPPANPRELWIIGALWLTLTITFEFVFGHFAMGHSWDALFSAYDPRGGQLWWLVLLTVLLAPPFLGRSRARKAGLTPIERHIEFIPEEQAASAVAWLADLFRDREVRYAAAGGLAARAWGAKRPLVDLDFYVHGEDLDRIESDLAPFVVAPLTKIENDHWDLSLLRLEYAGVPLELSVGEGAKYQEAKTGVWHDACPVFENCPELELFGTRLRVMNRDALIEYKLRVDRAVDRADVAAIEGSPTNGP
jgi:hypothetical protein